MPTNKERQRIIRAYIDETGEDGFDLTKVVRWAVLKGWQLPKPEDPFAVEAKKFADAAREQISYDKDTGKPYRQYHAITEYHGGTQLHLWIDIDTAPRPRMHKSLTKRRDAMISDGVMLSYDADHWNAAHKAEEPIQLEWDFTLDIEWRKNSPDDDDKKTG